MQNKSSFDLIKSRTRIQRISSINRVCVVGKHEQTQKHFDDDTFLKLFLFKTESYLCSTQSIIHVKTVKLMR